MHLKRSDDKSKTEELPLPVKYQLWNFGLINYNDKKTKTNNQTKKTTNQTKQKQQNTKGKSVQNSP